MAEDKKYLDLNGLGYTIRKIDNKKANLESPAFTGTPTVNGNKIISNVSIDDKNIIIQNDIKDEDASTSINSTWGAVTLHSGENVFIDGNKGINLHTGSGYTATYKNSEIATELSVETKLQEEFDTKFEESLEKNLDSKLEERLGNKFDEKANIESPEFTGVPTAPTAKLNDNSLQIANTAWVNNNYIGKQGDAVVNGTLTVIGNKYPILTLKSSTSTSSGYLMNIQGNLMFGDCTSNNASRQYYGRMVPALNQAIVGAVSIGYNPKDSANYQKTTDYGIKFDVDVAAPTSATPTILRQSGSFFVGVNGAFVGYSGSSNKPIDYSTQIYKVLDSNNIKTDEYIKSLEERIAALEALLLK